MDGRVAAFLSSYIMIAGSASLAPPFNPPSPEASLPALPPLFLCVMKDTREA